MYNIICESVPVYVGMSGALTLRSGHWLSGDGVTSSTVTDQAKMTTKVLHKLTMALARLRNTDQVSPVVVKTRDTDKDNSQKLGTHVLDQLIVDDDLEYRLCRNMCDELDRLLTSSGDRTGQGPGFLLPPALLPRVARQVLCLSEYEPCGIRGCVLVINLKDKSGCRLIGEIDSDPSTVATFELFLTVLPNTRPWQRAKHMFLSLKRFTLKNTGLNSPQTLSPDFSLTKVKLYRPN